LKLFGELDVASSAVLEDELARMDSGELVIVDLRELEFIDSSGIGVLVRAHQKAHAEGRRFALVQGEGQVAQLLQLTGLADQLTVVGAPAELLGD
jgi:anti-anti-sigma factor